MSSVKRKLSVKSLGEICQALRDLEKGLSNKDVSENGTGWYENVSQSSREIRNALNFLQDLCLFHEVGNDMLELLQRFGTFHVHAAFRKQSSILTYFHRK